jgi:hypothetical protein
MDRTDGYVPDDNFTLNEVAGKWRWLCGQCNGYSRNLPTAQQAQDDFYARHSPCPSLRLDEGSRFILDGADQSVSIHNSAAVARPPLTLYEVRTIHSESYWAEGDVIERGDGWFTLWASERVLALLLPTADIRAVRSVTEGEQEAAHTATGTAVQGRCPACGGGALFLGDGGYVTCPRIGCPEPDAASTLLERQVAQPRKNDHKRDKGTL